MILTVKKICVTCSQEFKIRRKNQINCSSRCTTTYKYKKKADYTHRPDIIEKKRKSSKEYNMRDDVKIKKRLSHAASKAMYRRYFAEKNQGETYKEFKVRMK